MKNELHIDTNKKHFRFISFFSERSKPIMLFILGALASAAVYYIFDNWFTARELAQAQRACVSDFGEGRSMGIIFISLLKSSSPAILWIGILFVSSISIFPLEALCIVLPVNGFFSLRKLFCLYHCASLSVYSWSVFFVTAIYLISLIAVFLHYSMACLKFSRSLIGELRCEAYTKSAFHLINTLSEIGMTIIISLIRSFILYIIQ